MPREGPVRTTRTGHQPQHQAQRCPSCGTEVAAGKRFCDDCGAPLTATAPPPKPTAPRTPPSPQGVEFAPDSPLEEDGFELLVPVVKRRPPREMETRAMPHRPSFSAPDDGFGGKLPISHSARSGSGIFVSVSGYPRQR